MPRQDTRVAWALGKVVGLGRRLQGVAYGLDCGEEGRRLETDGSPAWVVVVLGGIGGGDKRRSGVGGKS